MNRRKFLKAGSVAGLAAATFSSCDSPDTDKEAGKTTDESGDSFQDDFALNELTIDELQEKMKNGTYTSRSITEMYLQRINDIDHAGPELNAVIEINPDA